MATFLLVHSPLTGPLVWRAVAAALRSGGHHTHVPDVRAALGEVAAIARLARPHARNGPLVVVAHSGAGVAVPAVAAALRQPPAACVFADAQLPRPGLPADEAFLEFLRPLAGPGGLLPPFPAWWGEPAMAALVPDPALRARFESECPRLPLAAFTEPAPEVDGWPGAPCAFLRLSSAYDDAAAAATNLGWPVGSLDLHHLAPLTHPGEVARAIEALVP